jgi:putative intracellular protease/amidase
LTLAIKPGSNDSILKGVSATGFSNSEEAQTPFNDFVNILPFSLEDKIGQLGGSYVKGDDWASKVVWDGGILTGERSLCQELVSTAAEFNIRSKPGFGSRPGQEAG